MFTVVCVILALATLFVTEIAPVDSRWKPLIPKAIGVVAVAVGIGLFKMTYEEALGTFASVLSSSAISGLLKYTLALREPIKAATAKLPGHGGQKIEGPTAGGDGDSQQPNG